MAIVHRKRLVRAHGIAILAALAIVPAPLLMPLMVDEVLVPMVTEQGHASGPIVALMNDWFPESWHGPTLYILVMLMVALILRTAGVAFNVLQSREFVHISKDVIFRMRKNLLARLQRVSMSEYEGVGTGAVVSHLITDLDTVDQFIGAAISRFLVAVLSILGTGIILLSLHWQLGMILICLNPVVIFFTTALGKHVKKLKKKENEAYEAFQSALTETLEAIQQVRAANREGYYLDRMTELARGVRNYAGRYLWRSEAAGRLSFLVFLFGIETFRAVAMLYVVFSDLSLGLMIAVLGYLWFMMGPVQEILNIQYAYASANAALSRLNALMTLHPEPDYPHRQNPFEKTTTTSVTVENLGFCYSEGQPVLTGINLEIKAGERVALVGTSGGGKTTLAQLLIGLYVPHSGIIRYDGVPVTDIGLDVVRENVAMVLQHPALFNDTIRSNLTLGRSCSDDALWEALRVAQLQDKVKAMADGLDTVIGRQGIRLSGGQRQRLAVARMVLTNPRVVILDEATSALDSRTERQLHEALDHFLQGRTTIIIAHRLSAVQQADRAYVFEQGRIVEQGDHQSLLVRGGVYSALYGQLQGVAVG